MSIPTPEEVYARQLDRKEQLAKRFPVSKTKAVPVESLKRLAPLVPCSANQGKRELLDDIFRHQQKENPMICRDNGGNVVFNLHCNFWKYVNKGV